jgi:hypothetical protein
MDNANLTSNGFDSDIKSFFLDLVNDEIEISLLEIILNNNLDDDAYEKIIKLFEVGDK